MEYLKVYIYLFSECVRHYTETMCDLSNISSSVKIVFEVYIF